MKYIIFCICLMIALACSKKAPIPTINHVELNPDHDRVRLTPQNVYQYLMDLDVKFADIVLRQSILESGWYTSYNCLTRNNLFGMTGSEKTEANPNGYMTYKNWQYSCRAYLRWQRRKYGDSNQNYYDFLNEIGYAESPTYTEKLQHINILVVKI